MEQDKIIQVITDLFKGADEHDWQKCQHSLADQVLLDYTTMVGGEPATLTPKQITDSWSAFLPGFDKTHHQLTGFVVKITENQARAHYHGKADHFIDNDIWIVEGSYDTELLFRDGRWVITKQKLNFDKQSGNVNLPALATQRIKKTDS